MKKISFLLLLTVMGCNDSVKIDSSRLMIKNAIARKLVDRKVSLSGRSVVFEIGSLFNNKDRDSAMYYRGKLDGIEEALDLVGNDTTISNEINQAIIYAK